MKEPSEIVKRYVEGLTLRRQEREEVENVILGYMTDCTAKDKQIAELREKAEAALSDLGYLLKHQKTNLIDGSQLIDGQSAHELLEALRK